MPSVTACRAARPPSPARRAAKTQILRDGEQAVYTDLLEHEAEPLPHGAALSRGVVAEDSSPAAGGCQQGGEEEHCGGLAGAVGAQQADQSTRGHLEVEGVERSRSAVVTSQPLGLRWRAARRSRPQRARLRRSGIGYSSIGAGWLVRAPRR